MKSRFCLLLSATLILLAACTPKVNETPAKLTGIKLNKKSLELEIEEQYQLRVKYTPEDAAEFAPAVEWKSEDKEIARVTSEGKVTAKAAGNTIITATCGEFTAECEVTVLAPEQPEQPDGPEQPDEPKPSTSFSVSPQSIKCGYAGGLFTIEVKTREDADWTVSTDAEWITLSQSDGTGTGDIEVSVAQSYVKETTTADIVFSWNHNDVVVTVTRAGCTAYFSVSGSKKVIFAPGNLQYQASTGTWRFAEHQYDIIGSSNKNISASYSEWIDLFGWGTGNNPTLVSKDADDYSVYTDWGVNAISNGGNEPNLWYTLTAGEFYYLLESRTNAGALRGKATVCGQAGAILLPDTWTAPDGITFDPSAITPDVNDYSAAQWQQMKLNGAVFLPEAGQRRWQKPSEEATMEIMWNNDNGYYYTAESNYTTTEDYHTEVLFFSSSSSYKKIQISTNYNANRPYGLSVRLVRTW